ncbi:MAG: hypothetical protein AVDCRST_MAG19-1910 [uncultured Thermomicrobiales bacterium]|uniref:PDZ domain-containing protein n=1 Tax=uncultured Thermomicrobiales bacterium TaxID=1645740 RepID=A0A6J4UZ06_9BACT|nr:MAG: hypothetical protein AVDCRST_MAG19-1910 [uncultured Thermomicrobiales bacterium]
MVGRKGRSGLVLAGLAMALVGCGGGEEGDEPAAVATLAPSPGPGAEATGAPVVQVASRGTTAADGAAGAPAALVTTGPAGAASDGAVSAPLNAVEVVERVSPAVVTVINERQAGRLGEGRTLEAGRGTGFIVDERGHVVTNWHVVEGADRFEVILADGEKRPAELVGSDRLSDLAIVRVEGELPAVVPFGDSEALRVGQPVLAIGSPLGDFTGTVTDGIVSSLDRDFPGSAAQGEPVYSNLVQHNAAINPGNSGGPLFDLAGRVIGVNTLGIPTTDQGVPAQGLFFAIPSNTVQRIAAQLIEEGRVAYPLLGVQRTVPITPELVSQYDIPVDHGLYVPEVVPGGPADAGGIEAGDFLLAIGDDRIDADTSFNEALYEHRPGETVPVTVRRGDEELRLEVTLGERPTR